MQKRKRKIKAVDLLKSSTESASSRARKREQEGIKYKFVIQKRKKP